MDELKQARSDIFEAVITICNSYGLTRKQRTEILKELVRISK